MSNSGHTGAPGESPPIVKRTASAVRLLTLCLLLVFPGIQALRAEQPSGTGRATPQQEGRHDLSQLEVSSLGFSGNETLTTSELKGQVATRETPGWFNKFLYNSISERLGRKDEYFNAVTLNADLERLRKYYRNRGFYDVRIDTALTTYPQDGRIDIQFVIEEGYRSVIDTLIYSGIVDEPGTIWDDIHSSPKIVRGDPFNRVLLEDEVKRVLRILNDTGYPNAVYLKDSSKAVRKTSSRNYSVVLAFIMHRRYLFGDVIVVQQADSLRPEPLRTDIKVETILDHLDFKKGDFYGLQKKIDSERNLNRLGIFDLRSFTMQIPPPSDTTIWIPSVLVYHPRDKHELAPELLVSDENAALNLGGGLVYTQRNFLGGGRTFNARARFRSQTIGMFPHYFAIDNDAIANLELTFEIQQPYVFSNKLRGTWSFSYIADKEKPYLQNILRNKFGFSGRSAEFTTGYLDWTLEAVDLLKNPNFGETITDPSILQAIRNLQNKQLNSILSFTLQRDKSNDIFSPSEGFVHSITIDESGILPLALRKVFPRLPFTQFLRLVLAGRWYTDLTDHRFTIFAMKLRAGYQEKYGESRSDTGRSIPQTYRFYAGGGSSVRGWSSRGLIAAGNPQLGGNLDIEASFELRMNVLQPLRDGMLDKIWLVQFVDLGNVWPVLGNVRINTIAAAMGIGFRYDTFFGPFRIDFGIRIYDPGDVQGRRWITQREFFGQTVKQGVLHFGIGHAF